MPFAPTVAGAAFLSERRVTIQTAEPYAIECTHSALGVQETSVFMIGGHCGSCRLATHDLGRRVEHPLRLATIDRAVDARNRRVCVADRYRPVLPAADRLQGPRRRRRPRLSDAPQYGRLEGSGPVVSALDRWFLGQVTASGVRRATAFSQTLASALEKRYRSTDLSLPAADDRPLAASAMSER